MWRWALFLLLVPHHLLAAEPAWQRGLAMVGEPALAPDFQHFAYTNPDAPKGGVLRQAVVGSFDSLNPFIVFGQAAQGLGYLHDGLMARHWDEPFSLYPLIAEAVRLPPDRSWIEFRLNPKARCQDGSKLGVADVMFSHQMLSRHGRPNARRTYGLATPRQTGERTVRFDFAAGFDRETALIQAMMPVLCQAAWQGRDFTKTTLQPFIGTGAYRVARLEAGRFIEYARVTDYWAADLPVNKGLHNFDRLVFDYYRDDNIAREAFKAGGYDLRREQEPLQWVQAYGGAGLQRGDYRLLSIPYQRPDWLRAIIFNSRRPLLQDVALRQALRLAYDFDSINRLQLAGLAKPGEGVFPGSELSGVPPFRVPMRDGLVAAQDRLRQAGYRMQQGQLHSPEGKRLELELLLASPREEKLALAYARNLERLGIALRVRTVDSAEFAGRLDKFDYDLLLHRWLSGLSPGNEQRLYWGSQAVQARGSRNYAGVQDARIDGLITRITQADNRAELIAAAQAMDKILRDGAYFIPLYYLPAEWLAVSRFVAMPPRHALYGAVVESWWHHQQ